MATFVPGFVSQTLRDWLKRSRDAYGKAPLASDPKAQMAELETRQGAAPRATLDRSRRPHRLSRRDGGARPCRHRLGFLRRPAADRPRTCRLLPASVRRTVATRLLGARPREDRLRNVLRVMRKVEQVGERSARDARAGGRTARGLPGRVSDAAARPSLALSQYPALMPLPVALAQRRLVELAGRQARQLRLEVDRARAFGCARCSRQNAISSSAIVGARRRRPASAARPP